VPLDLTLNDASLDQLAVLIAERLADRLPKQSDDGWMESKEAAVHLKVPLSTIRKWTAEGSIPFTQDGPGARCFFLRSELDRWRLSSAQGPRH
jgi:excisionase family DNA binding protein